MSPINTRERVCVLAVALVIATLGAARPGAAQAHRKPLTKDEIVGLLSGDVAQARVGQLAQQQGIDFQMTPDNERDLKQAGANDELLNILREIAPKPLSPPVVEVLSAPGSAQVYVDDALVAKTSPEGHVRITNLAPGQHRVRLSLGGYDDYETQISLSPGNTAMVTAVLKVHAATGLDILSSPGHAQVYVDDVFSGETSDAGQLKILNLAPGNHRVRLTRDGYREAQQQVEVASGQTQPLAIILVKSEPATVPVAAAPIRWQVEYKAGSLAYTPGLLTVENGVLSYRSDNGKHSFQFQFAAVGQAYQTLGDMRTRHDLHIVLRSGQKYEFILQAGAGHGVAGAQFVQQMLAILNQAGGQASPAVKRARTKR